MKKMILVATAALTILCSGAGAETLWNAAAGDWSTDSLWSPQVKPISTETVKIDNGGTSTVSQAGAEAFTVYVGSDDNKTGTLHIASGDLAVSEHLYFGYSGGVGHHRAERVKSCLYKTTGNLNEECLNS